jgi:uncharacterized membrane protein YccC
MSNVAAAPVPFSFAGAPLASWAFALRIWIAVIVALYASFWLQLDAASSAAVTVAIVAIPTRGQALEKAGFRLIGTIIGVTASIVLIGTFSQARDLLLVAFAAWIGLCVYAAGLWDGNRAYAAVLSGYTVGLVAIQQIDTPTRVFDAGVQRGAAIAVGIAAVALVNDLLVAPDRHIGLAVQLADLHRRVREHAKAVLRRDAGNATASAGLLREIAALRPEVTSLATESSSGPARSTAARSAAVALVAQLQAARVLGMLPAAAQPALRDRLISQLEENAGNPIQTVESQPDSLDASADWAARELLRRDREVCEDLAALKAGLSSPRAWRAPFYRCHRLAVAAGGRAALWFAPPAALLVLAGWPSANLSLALVPVLIGLGATSPNQRAFTGLALIATPIAVALAGILEFLVLDGVTQFPLLALALAPVVIGMTLLMAGPNPVLASIGRLGLIFTLAIFAPSNPQTYDPQAFLFASLFVCLSVGLLLASQFLLPPLSDEHRRQGLMASAQRELAHLPQRHSGRYAPEEAMFRDAVRIGQIAGTGAAGPQQRAVLEQALVLFDRAAMIRLCDARLTRLATGPAADLAEQAQQALIARDSQAMRRAASALHAAATDDGLVLEASEALQAASLVLEEKRP